MIVNHPASSDSGTAPSAVLGHRVFDDSGRRPGSIAADLGETRATSVRPRARRAPRAATMPVHPHRAHGGAVDPGHPARHRHPDVPRCDEVGQRPGRAVQPEHRPRQCQGAFQQNSQSYAGARPPLTVGLSRRHEPEPGASSRVRRADHRHDASPRSACRSASRRQRGWRWPTGKGTSNCWYLIDNTADRARRLGACRPAGPPARPARLVPVAAPGPTYGECEERRGTLHRPAIAIARPTRDGITNYRFQRLGGFPSI